MSMSHSSLSVASGWGLRAVYSAITATVLLGGWHLYDRKVREAILLGRMNAMVFNASGFPGLALKATEALKSRGVTVLSSGDGGMLQPTMRIAVFPADYGGVAAIRRALGCPASAVAVERVPGAHITGPISVYVGQNYARCGKLGN